MKAVQILDSSPPLAQVRDEEEQRLQSPTCVDELAVEGMLVPVDLARASRPGLPWAQAANDPRAPLKLPSPLRF